MPKSSPFDPATRARTADILSRSANRLAAKIGVTAAQADALQKYLLVAITMKVRAERGEPYQDLQDQQTRLWPKLAPRHRQMLAEELDDPPK